ncbi:MAG TPA: M13 family metallopeptidase, partial [Rhodothermales bacterium]|nr:M13 family metallopeptidase [Rhodothermales bacterium]
MRLLRLAPLALAALALGAPARAQQALGIDRTAFDTSVRPQDDFYRYVNGHWLATFEIPADRSRYGAFDALGEQSRRDVRTLIEEAAAGGFAGDPDAARVGAFFTAFMDSARAETLGAAPVRADLERIDAVRTMADLPSYFAHTAGAFGAAPFGAFVNQDAKDAQQYALYLTQGGLGLPDQSYYVADQFATQRAAYTAYIARLYELAGLPDGAAAAERVLALETGIARIQWTRVQNRDREATYNKMSMAEVAAAYPHLGWATYVREAGLSAADSVIVRQPTYFAALDSLLGATTVEAWRDYARSHALDQAAPLLSSDFVNAHFEFNGRTLSGQPALAPRWRRAVNATNGALGEAVGRLFVSRHFRPEARVRMDALIANLREAFRASITDLDWMSPATRAEALDKLNKFTPKIGYPERWRDYSTLQADATDLVGNARRSAAFGYAYMTGRLSRSVDRGEWGMTPQTVNAYYNSTMNEIVFPAAILRPPFFDPTADDAVNYGGIGAVIGHEFSHGFDDQGRRSDGNGNLRDWWTEADATEYTRRAQQVVDQYNAFAPLEGTHINGELTLGENIADL